MGKLIREGSTEMKTTFEDLMNARATRVEIDEQIVYNQLSAKKNVVWSLLLASRYLKVVSAEYRTATGEYEYELVLTNKKVWIMFWHMIQGRFAKSAHYNGFIKA